MALATITPLLGWSTGQPGLPVEAEQRRIVSQSVVAMISDAAQHVTHELERRLASCVLQHRNEALGRTGRLSRAWLQARRRSRALAGPRHKVHGLLRLEWTPSAQM